MVHLLYFIGLAYGNFDFHLECWRQANGHLSEQMFSVFFQLFLAFVGI